MPVTKAHTVPRWPPIKPQCQSNWCWASVAEYLHRVHQTQPSVSQEQVATNQQQDPEVDCSAGCAPAAGPVCNHLASLCRVLSKEGLLFEARSIASIGSAEIQIIDEELSQGRPVAFGCPSRGGHFSVITNRLRGSGFDYFEIMDPAGGMVRYVDVADLPKGYSCWGPPNFLYLTRSRKEDPQGQCDGERDSTTIPRFGNTHCTDAKPLAEQLGREIRDGWKEATTALLEGFLQFDHERTWPLRNLRPEQIELLPFKLQTFDPILQNRFLGLSVCAAWGVALIERESRRSLGVLELFDAGDEWILETFTLAPGRKGDRFVDTIRRTLQGFGQSEVEDFAVLRSGFGHETVILTFSSARYSEKRKESLVIPLDSPFGFLDFDSPRTQTLEDFVERLEKAKAETEASSKR